MLLIRVGSGVRAIVLTRGITRTHETNPINSMNVIHYVNVMALVPTWDKDQRLSGGSPRCRGSLEAAMGVAFPASISGVRIRGTHVS